MFVRFCELILDHPKNGDVNKRDTGYLPTARQTNDRVSVALEYIGNSSFMIWYRFSSMIIQIAAIVDIHATRIW